MLSLWPLTEPQARIVRDAYREAGIRVVLGLQLADTGQLDTIPMLRDILPVELYGTASGPPAPADMPNPTAELDHILSGMPAAPDELVTWAVCPSSPERCSRELLEALSDVAERYASRLFSHVAISRVEAVAAQRLFAADGGSPVHYLHRLGMLGRKLTLAHGVWLDHADCALLAETGTRLVLNPMSNLKTRNGVAPFRSYLKSGVTLGLGCDNCSCSDAQNMFQAMKLSVLLAGIEGRTDDGPTAANALWVATVGGAHAVGLETSIGRIKPGYRADITFLDLADPTFRPLNDTPRQLVYGEGGRGVVSVMVDGRFVVRDRRVTTIDEGALAEELSDLMPAFRTDADAVISRALALDPYLARVEAMSWEHDVGMSRMLCR
jgi:cytosine/adenosine deaminase-related metal-dependent hydrolase